VHAHRCPTRSHADAVSDGRFTDERDQPHESIFCTRPRVSPAVQPQGRHWYVVLAHAADINRGARRMVPVLLRMVPVRPSPRPRHTHPLTKEVPLTMTHASDVRDYVRSHAGEVIADLDRLVHLETPSDRRDLL